MASDLLLGSACDGDNDDDDNNNDDDVRAREEEIARLGGEIRALKDCKAGKEEVMVLVQQLLELKNSLPEGHPLRPDVARAEAAKQKKSAPRHDATRKLDAGELATHLVQRKIHNVLEPMRAGSGRAAVNVDDDDEHEQGDREFRLNPRAFNVARTGLGFAKQNVIATEKWDGTTMQASREGVFKRRDLFTKGDAKKHTADQHERYTLVEVDIQHKSNRHYRAAMKPHLRAFKALPEGCEVYFEVIGPKIQSRFAQAFPQAEGVGTIRVFDSSRNGNFLPFPETARLAQSLGLPLVSYFTFSTEAEEKSPQDVIDLVARIAAEGVTYSHAPELVVPVPLEGYVFRSVENPNHVAKIRVSDLALLG